MNERIIIFSPRAQTRLNEIADYLYRKNLSKKFVRDYINSFEKWLNLVLGQFPESGCLMSEYGDGIRRIAYREYSFIYRVNIKEREILTIYRENQP